jgi:hypothetical protein
MRSLFSHSTTRDDEHSLGDILQRNIVQRGSGEFENVLKDLEALSQSTFIEAGQPLSCSAGHDLGQPPKSLRI